MNTHQLRAEFLESEIEEIIFTYDRNKDILYFSEYSVSMLGVPKEIENPLSSKEVLRRISKEEIINIVHSMDFESQKKEEMIIQFMRKPFILKYQVCKDKQDVQSVVCLIKEKYIE